MNDTRIVDIEGIGPVMFVKSRRAKRINISIRPPHCVRIAVPHRTSVKKAVVFCRLQEGWIRKQLDLIEKERHRLQPLRKTLSDYDTHDANQWLKDRLAYLAQKYGFTYGRISVRSQRTRWGSCSHTNNISLNIKLIVLPGELIDYVLLHELVHTRIHNHSSEFWKELDRYVDGAKKTAKRLREYNLRLL